MIKYENLYETVNKIYSESTPISRMLCLAKLKESHGEKQSRDYVKNQFVSEIKLISNKTEGFNCCILILGAYNAFLLIEVNIIIK
jgi:hypothetical protein